MNRENISEKSLEYRHKIMVLGFIGTMMLASYFIIKYILPLLWPFIAGVVLALIFKPVIQFLNKYLRINTMVGTLIVLGFVSAIIQIVAGFLIRGMLSQITILFKNMDIYMAAADDYLCDMCNTIGKTVGMEGDSLFLTVTRNINEFMSGLESKITAIIMGTSIPAIMAFVELIIGVALVIVSLFLFVKDMDKIKKYLKTFYFSKEVMFVTRRVFVVTKAYFKAQIIIMAIIALECVAGFMFLGNKYALLLGVLIGALDALPLFGVGAILLPWTIIYIAMGDFVKAAIMFTIFIVCYFTREFLEPKLIGNKIGINPIVALMSIYIGFKILGFAGMFMAPLVFVIVRDATRAFSKFIKT